MAIAVWSASLPVKIRNPSLTKSPTILRSATDSGIAQTRKRFTSSARIVRFEMLFTGAQLAAFETWWDTIWSQPQPDTGKFQFDDPITDKDYTAHGRAARIMSETFPDFTLISGHGTPDNRIYSASMMVEFLP